MKRVLSVLLIFFCTFTVAAQKEFEGEINYILEQDEYTFKIKVKIAAMKMNYTVTDSISKLDGVSTTYDYRNSIILTNYSRAKTTLVDYITLKTQAKSKAVLFKKTGRNKQIFGYDCEELELTDSIKKNTQTGTYFIWICKDLKVSLPLKYASGFAGFVPVIFNEHLVMEKQPLAGSSGFKVSSITAVSVISGHIPAKIFEIPPGYKAENYEQLLKETEKRWRADVTSPPLKKGEKIRANPKSKRKQ